MRQEPKLYFAYGSNLNLRQMQRRCPGARKVDRIELKGWELVFRGVADIVPSLKGSVQGAIYTITAQDERALDRYEGFNPNAPLQGMYRKEYFQVKYRGKTCDVMFYVMNSKLVSAPSAGYFESINQGYEDWELNPKPLYEAAARAAA